LRFGRAKPSFVLGGRAGRAPRFFGRALRLAATLPFFFFGPTGLPEDFTFFGPVNLPGTSFTKRRSNCSRKYRSTLDISPHSSRVTKDIAKPSSLPCRPVRPIR